jgi:hypothetical protein
MEKLESAYKRMGRPGPRPNKNMNSTTSPAVTGAIALQSAIDESTIGKSPEDFQVQI